MRSTFIFTLCVFLFAGSAFAQGDRGTITGTVSDATNAVIPGAGVTATNTQTTAKYETVSTETGNYTLAQLPAGVYDLTVELPGFKKYVRQGTELMMRGLYLDLEPWEVHLFTCEVRQVTFVGV